MNYNDVVTIIMFESKFRKISSLNQSGSGSDSGNGSGLLTIKVHKDNHTTKKPGELDCPFR